MPNVAVVRTKAAGEDAANVRRGRKGSEEE